MYPDALLTNLMTQKDPLEPILSWLVEKLDPSTSLVNITRSYERFEEELMDFEKWLHQVWGNGFYETLIGNTEDYAIPKAFQLADRKKGNILFFDGFSIRELLILLKAFPDRLQYDVGRAPVPTTTESAAKKVFQSSGLKEALTGTKLYWGKKWRGALIEDISHPPRIGSQTGLMFLTYYPDAPLHHAIRYGSAVVQNISEVIKQILQLVTEMSRNVPLIMTGDHGYIYLSDNPNKYMWLPYRRQQRFGEEYNSNFMEINGIKVAIGRYHAPLSSRSDAVITHGGISLSESLVPIVILEAENPK